MHKDWEYIDIKKARQLGTLIGTLSYESSEDGYFEIYHVDNKLVFGGFTNNSFLQSGFMEIEDYESVDEALSELQDDLEVYYRDGPEYTNRIVYNERM